MIYMHVQIVYHVLELATICIFFKEIYVLIHIYILQCHKIKSFDILNWSLLLETLSIFFIHQGIEVNKSLSLLVRTVHAVCNSKSHWESVDLYFNNSVDLRAIK